MKKFNKDLINNELKHQKSFEWQDKKIHDGHKNSLISHAYKHPYRERHTGKWNYFIDYHTEKTMVNTYLYTSVDLAKKSSMTSNKRWSISYREKHDSYNILDNNNKLMVCLKYWQHNHRFYIATCYFLRQNQLKFFYNNTIKDDAPDIIGFEDAFKESYETDSTEYKIVFENDTSNASNIVDSIVKEVDSYLTTTESIINNEDDKRFYFVFNDGIEYVIKMAVLYKLNHIQYNNLHKKFLNIDIKDSYKYALDKCEKCIDEMKKHIKHYEIDIRKLNEEKLNELRNILEKYTIEKIENCIKSENKITIIYNDKKEKTTINEKYKWNVELIRNKYYRLLLNIVNEFKFSIVGKKVLIDICCFNEFSEKVSDTSILRKENYEKLLKMTLINYIGTYNFDNIFELKRHEMLKTIENVNAHNSQNNHSKNNQEIDISEALGMYCHNSKYLLDEIEGRISKKKLNEIKKCKKFILICPELIKEFCGEHLDDFKKYDIRNKSELYDIIFNKVLAHEIGHGVFDDYINDYENEKRANYFASLTFDGTFDKIIKKMTDIQGKKNRRYRDPILVSKMTKKDDSISTIYDI